MSYHLLSMFYHNFLPYHPSAVDLCALYRIEDAAEFVEQWVAFSISNLNGAEPAVEHLNEFERKVFQAKREKELLAASKKKGGKFPSAISNLTHLNNISASTSSNPLAMYGVEDDDVMDEYMQDSAMASGMLDDVDSMPGTPSVCHTPKVSLCVPFFKCSY